MDFRQKCKVCKKDVHCCIFKGDSGFVFVGIKDARRIRKAIDKDYDYFLDFSPLPKRLFDSIKSEADPALEGYLRCYQLDKDRRILRLKTKKGGRCIFLDDSGLCSIYDIRPNICRIFPFWALRLNSGRLKILFHDDYLGCATPKKSLARDDDAETVLSKKEIAQIKKVFKDIEKESVFYRKDIKRFIGHVHG